jgi:uncharacterized damage-inducible protein DinB
MIDRAYVPRMARCNRWQNENLYGTADRLSAEQRNRERGAFFGSIHKTLNNHQTHHRGRVYCMLTQAGARPSDTKPSDTKPSDTKPSDTDLPFLPD